MKRKDLHDEILYQYIAIMFRKKLISLAAFTCFSATLFGQTQSTTPAQQPTGHSGLYPSSNTQWVTAGSKPSATVAADDLTSIEPGLLIFHRDLEWDSTTNKWKAKGTGDWTQFISKGVRYQPTPPGLAGGEAGSPMGDLYYVGPPDPGHTWADFFYEPIWLRDLGPEGYVRQLGANNIGIYNLFNTPSITIETPDPSDFSKQTNAFIQPASGLMPTSTLIVDPVNPDRTSKTPAQGAETLPQNAVTIANPNGPAIPTHPDGETWGIDFSPLGPLRYTNTGPNDAYPPSASYMPEDFYQADGTTPVKQPPPHFYHFNHDRFLDICWNGGLLEPTTANPTGPFIDKLEPVYVWLAVGISNDAFPATGTTTKNADYYRHWQDYYNNLAAWMAQSYGQHPAVIGFILTNETNDGQDAHLGEYYEFLNTVNTTLKTYAPDKLTMVSFQDNIGSLTTQVNWPVGQTATQKYPFEIYEPDIYGWNLYTAPNSATDIVTLFDGTLALNPPVTSISQYFKPIIISEIGVPATMRYRSVPGVPNSSNGEPYFDVPNGYYYDYDSTTKTSTYETYSTSTVNPNMAILGRENPKILNFTLSDFEDLNALGSEHPIYGHQYASGLVVHMPNVNDGGSPYRMLETVDPVEWKNLDFSTTLAPVTTLFEEAPSMPGAGTTVILWSWLNALNSLAVPTDGTTPAGSSPFSGYMVFEYSDEWDKWTDASTSPSNVQTAAGVQDFSNKSITGWASPALPISGGGSEPISLNTTWDEEWFGLMSIEPVGRSSTSPAINDSGYLAPNGKASTLSPRMTFYAVQKLFTGNVTPVTTPPTTVTVPPTLLNITPGFTQNEVETDFFTHDNYGTIFTSPATTGNWAYFYDYLGWHYVFGPRAVEGQNFLINYSNTIEAWLLLFEDGWAYSFADSAFLWFEGGTNPHDQEQFVFIPEGQGASISGWVTIAQLIASRTS